VLTELEPHLVELKPAALVVVGDVNSTLGAALCAAKLGIPVVHVEAGLRSYRRDMPEEINRVVTDSISDLLLAPSDDAVNNLLREGHPSERIAMVGNVMIDSLELILPQARTSNILRDLQLDARSYFLATLHRPSNVDGERELDRMIDLLIDAAKILPVVFPVHPRTMSLLAAGPGLSRLESSRVLLIAPLGYIEFLALVDSSAAVLTDSGGIQEETTILGVPCLTLREETERPITVTLGTNHVVGHDRTRILAILERVQGIPRQRVRPPLWDGHTAERIIPLLEAAYS
jgi:UDP-N-acetylglucosamine 2-epimerase (non-hydrolysing)